MGVTEEWEGRGEDGSPRPGLDRSVVQIEHVWISGAKTLRPDHGRDVASTEQPQLVLGVQDSRRGLAAGSLRGTQQQKPSPQHTHSGR